MPINIKPSGRSLSSEELASLEKKSREMVRDIVKKPPSDPEKNKEPPKKDRFYLPVLRINDPTQWDSKPLSERKYFTDDVAKSVCIGNCCQVEGLSAGCCQLDPDDLEHVLGPVDEAWIKDTIKWFKKKGMDVTRHDIVIDYEEGKLIGQKFFNDHEVFKRPDTYPIIRIQASGIRFSCKFLNVQTGKCTIYAQRPNMCKDYYCSYIKANFLVKTKNHPNKYEKIG